MRSLPHIFTRFGAAVVILALSILSACNDKMIVAPSGAGPGAGPSTTVDVLFCAGEGAPEWVAFQDGDGAWTTASPITDGRHALYRQTFAANRGGMAVGQRFSIGLTTVSVSYGAPAELAAFGNTVPGDCNTSGPKALLGTIAGLDDNHVATISGGFSNAFIFPGDHSFVLGDLLDGPQTILATLTNRANDLPILDKLIVRRTPSLPDSTTIPVLDFNSEEAFAPAVANVTIEGLGPEGAQTLTRLVTANSQSIISFLSNSTTAATRSYNALPESRLAPTDLQALTVSGRTTAELTTRVATIYFRAPVDQTIALGPAAAAPAISVIARTPALRLQTVIAPQTVYDRFASINYQQGSTLVSVGMTTQYASLSNRGYDLSIPDFSTVPGFDPQWALRAAATGGIFWTETRIGGTLGIGANTIAPTNGAFSISSSRNGTFTP
jgi:hypothetical protein